MIQFVSSSVGSASYRASDAAVGETNDTIRFQFGRFCVISSE